MNALYYCPSIPVNFRRLLLYMFRCLLAVSEVFSLKRVSKTDTFFQSSADSSVERLAKFFGVSSGGFQEQLHRLRPLAEKRCRDTNGGTREAWTATMKATQRRNSSQDCSAIQRLFFVRWSFLLIILTCQESYPTADIAPVMRRYLAWQASTSGVEQNFARGERKNAFGQTPASDVFEERAMKLMLCDFIPAELEVILRDSQQLYMKCMPGA